MEEAVTPTNYHDFRKRFLDKVQAKALQLHSIQIRGLSPQGRPMFTDIAHSVINPHLPTFIHISGTHGIEGYIGSAVQNAIISELEVDHHKSVNLVFIHALNPWGMAWYRRTNGQNIDLNRNFFPEEAERPMNADFDLFAELFEKRPTRKKWQIYRSVLWNILKLGPRKTAAAISSGQYHHPDSLFYGGTELQNEIREPLHYLRKRLKENSPIYVIDVHAGLGRYKMECPLLDESLSTEEQAFWPKALQKDFWPASKKKNIYRSEGHLGLAFRSTFSQKRVYFLVTEFGTFSPLKVLRTLIRENKIFLKLKLDRHRAFTMISTFFPYEKSWREDCVKTGKETYFKVLSQITADSKSA